MKPLLTVFTAPKPFAGESDRLQRNAFSGLKALGPRCQVIIIGDESGIAEVASTFGFEHIANVERNRFGTPLMSSIFEIATRQARADLLCYINSDILVFADFLANAERVARHHKKLVLVGRRHDLDVTDAVNMNSATQCHQLRQRCQREASLHPPSGIDYLVFRCAVSESMPRFALGRPLWDNWFLYEARRQGVPVIDATLRITVIHQNHGYGHLRDRDPDTGCHLETEENLDLLGGYSRAFTIDDATHRLSASGSVVLNLRWDLVRRQIRQQEVLHPVLKPLFSLARRCRSLPRAAFNHARGWLS